ncbi:MAG: hypothetical protein H6825_14495 [Planctomycetes bacterium]|nr:hypothetical protein [Planctomycetota bacterium]
MSFQAFRKYEKPLLLVACVFTIVVFAFFPAFGDITDVLSGRAGGNGGDLYGAFTVATTGETREVTQHEFEATRNNLARLFQQQKEWTENDVWAHLIETADAHGAGLEVSKKDLVDQLKSMTDGQINSPEEYRALVMNYLRFSSLKAFEEFMSDIVVKQRWREVRMLAAEVVDADEVYERWKTDNELFDYEALVFADLDPESVADPGDEVLKAYFDEMPEWQRDRTFSEKAKEDVVYGWLPLSALDEVPEGVLAQLPQPTDAEIEARFQRVGRLRFPDLTELDAETRELLRGELQVIAAANAAHEAALAAQAAAREAAGDQAADVTIDKATFMDIMRAHGLRVLDPVGMLDPEGLKVLEGIGNDRLPLYLARVAKGEMHYLAPFAGDEEVHVVLVEDKQDERPLGFDEARDQVLASWRENQVSVPARAFRDELRKTARDLPEVVALVEPILAQATAAAEAEIGSAGDVLDADAKEAIRQEKLDNAQGDIDSRVAQFEGQAWDQLAPTAAAEHRTFTDVSRAYRLHPDENEDAAGLDRFLKTNTAIFAQGVDGVTDVLRHAGSKSSVIVRVTARHYPDKAAMLADTEGMQSARQQLAMAKRMEFFQTLTPDEIVADHALKVAPKPVTDDKKKPAPAGN